MTRMSGAKAVVEVLKEEGIQHVFHLPGSQIIDILDEIYQSGIRPVMTRHEQGAAFMADGYARATRGVGICMSTVGPGAMNLVAGIAASYKASIPVIAITGIHEQAILERDSFHEMDQAGVFRPITKWSAYVHFPEKVPEMMRKAFRVALSGRKGPVHLAIPSDVSEGMLEFKPSHPSEYRSFLPPSCPEEFIDKVIGLLQKSKFPVILAGGEVKWSGAVEDLVALAEAMEIPGTTNRDHPDAFPSKHPLGVGMIGKGRGEGGNRVMKSADLVLALGVKFDYQSTRHNYDIIPRGARIVHVSLDSEEVGRIYPVDEGIVCDVGPVIKALTERVKQERISFGLKKAIDEIKQESEKVKASEAKMDALPLRPQAIVRTLRELLPPESIAVVDGGNFAKSVRRHFETVEAGTFEYPDDFGSVGASFPMALGVKVGKPKSPVVCLCGDGGFLLNSQELETAVRERINIMTVIFNDSGYGNVRAYQKARFQERYMCNFDNPPYGEMARLFKADGRNVETPDALKEAVRAGLESDKPYIIDVRMTGQGLKPGFLKE